MPTSWSAEQVKEMPPSLDISVRVLLVDDDPLMRRGLRGMLEAGGVEVVAEAGNGRDAVKLAREVEPDVIVMDLVMPVVDGIAATRAIASASDAPPVLVFTSDDSDLVIDALVAGARSYVLKTARADDIVGAIRTTAAGLTALPPAVAGRIVDRLQALDRQRPALVDAREHVLSDREREVLGLIARGLDNGAIARELAVSVGTVKNYVGGVLGKLDLDNRTQAAAEAVRLGLA